MSDGGFFGNVGEAAGSAFRPQPGPQREGVFSRIGRGARAAFGGFTPGSPLDPRRRELERQRGILEQTPEELEEPAVRGEDRLLEELRANPHKPGTAEYDRWVLGLREDPLDPAYNIALRVRQGPAFRREEMRANPDTFGNRPGEPITPEDFEARARAKAEQAEGPLQPRAKDPTTGRLRPKVVVLGPDGEPLPDQLVLNETGMLVPLSEEEAGLGSAFQIGAETLQAGQFVWMGDMTGEMPGGRFGPRETVTDAYMNGEDAILLPYRWTPEQVAYAQEAVGLDPTGFVDQQLVSAWTDIVASAAGYTQAGRRVDPFMLLDMTFDATQAAARGGGGGGGAAFSLSETTAVLNAVMIQEAGREATNSEAEQFNGAFNGAGEVDPTQFAIDWIRSVAGGEAASFQVATDYYTAMLQILGAQTQAEEGPQ